jgi:hypothetical protein
MLITACIGLFFNIINMFVLEYAFNPEVPKDKEADIEDAKVAPIQSLGSIPSESNELA